MVQDGVFGEERKRSAGRPRWRLVDENLGKELDISSAFCIPVRSKALRKTADADKEEWDIIDGPGSRMNDASTSDSGPLRRIRKQPIRARSAIKPMGGKIAVMKHIKNATSQHENASQTGKRSPQLLYRSDIPKSRRRMPSVSPMKRSKESPHRVTPKRKAAAGLAHSPRKARKIQH